MQAHSLAAPRPLVPNFSTDEIAPQERMQFWRDLTQDRVVPLNFQFQANRPFDGSLSHFQMGDISIVSIKASPHLVVRDTSRIMCTSKDMLVLNFVTQGSCRAVQDGREVRVLPGSAVLCNAARHYALHFDEDFQINVLTFPKDLISRGVACPDRGVAQDLAQSSQLFFAVAAYVNELAVRPPALDEVTAHRVERNLGELISTMIGEVVQQLPHTISEHKSVTLTRIRAFIEQNLSDPDLGLCSVAKSFNMSPRYINKLLEADDTSLNRMLLRRRLDRVAEDLRDPSMVARTISAVAMVYGFNDLSYFSKAFRQMFGMSPREYRRGSH